MQTSTKLALGAVAFAALAACDYSGDFLFPGAPDGVESIMDIKNEDGSTFLDIVTADDIDANGLDALAAGAVYAELGPTGDATTAGFTITLTGTGNDVCVWLDPETLHWNQSISPAQPIRKYAYPDNEFDDGDIDLAGGLSVGLLQLSTIRRLTVGAD